MKFFANVFVFGFIVLAGYLLLHEKGASRPVTVKRVAEITGTTRKLIGQRPSRDLYPFELQRQRIESETTYKFQSNSSGESYELQDSDMEKFGVQLMDFKNVNRGSLRRGTIINETKRL